MSARGLLFAGGVLLAASIAACSAVLGFDTFSLDPAAAAEGGADGASGDGASGGEAGVPSCESSNKDTSPFHCGACNHDCLGGDCHMGVCQPQLVADALAKPEGLTVTNDFIFVAEFSARRILKFDRAVKGSCSGTPCTFVDTGNGADNPTGMGSDDTNVYWASYSSETDPPGIHSCPIAGCTTPKVLTTFGTDVLQNNVTPNDVLPLQLVVKDGQIFWGQNNDGAIQSVTPGGKVSTWLAPNNKYSPIDIAVSDTTIFFTVNGLAANSAEILGVARQPSAPAFQVAQAPATTYGISLSPAGTLYWTLTGIFDETYQDGAVQSAPSTQTGTNQGLGFSASQANARMIQSDETYVYWIVGGLYNLLTKAFDTANGSIVYCPISGCPADGPTKLATNQGLPRHLTQDAKGLYWTNEGTGDSNGQLWKVAKPVKP